ncbi:MAG TPA: Sec-independent protein translocase subunit TatA [Jatrophihabitans sp.]|nr:Sec-independent protein translocase subunit TatA [Jatrophihabitans sp.]
MGGWDAPWHWIVVAVLVIALFGAKRLPDAARSLGRSLRIFKTEIKGMSEDDKARVKAREDAENAEPRALPAAEFIKRDNGAPGTHEAGPVDGPVDGASAPRPRPSPTGQRQTSAQKD